MLLSLYQLCQGWMLWRGPLLRDCHFTPRGAHLFPREAYLWSSGQCLSVPKCVSGSHFSGAREASLTARIIALLPTCCTKYNVNSPHYIYELNEATSS